MEKIFILQKRTAWMCEKLDELKIKYYRNPSSNIITIKNEFISDEIAQMYGLVPDNHKDPKWNKIVIMDHVTIERLSELIADLDRKSTRLNSSHVRISYAVFCLKKKKK